jgi:hypothetical protein
MKFSRKTRIISPAFTYSIHCSYFLHMTLVTSQSGRSCAVIASTGYLVT